MVQATARQWMVRNLQPFDNESVEQQDVLLAESGQSKRTDGCICSARSEAEVRLASLGNQ